MVVGLTLPTGHSQEVIGMAILAFLSRGDDPEFGTFAKALKSSAADTKSAKNKKTDILAPRCITMVLPRLR